MGGPGGASSPPYQLPKKRVQECEDEIHDQEAVQFLAHKVFPALALQGGHPVAQPVIAKHTQDSHLQDETPVQVEVVKAEGNAR